MTSTTERVGRYQLLDPIGVGPNGTVSRAKVFGVAGFERQFAIKRFHSELTGAAVLAQALSAAARAYGSLEHPRIARMSEFGVAQGTTFTAVEFVAGLDALRLISEARMAGAALAAGGALALVSQAARAVGYAHGRGLTHLGLAPTNVMVTPEGDVKITDFGILSAALPQKPIEVPRLMNRIPYLAPEQLANEATSAATDVFALGVLAYELVTGHRTFRGETPQQIAQSVMAGPPLEPPLPRPIVRVLQRCLARSPFERFPDARALADALDAALRVAPVPGTRKDIGAQVKQTMDRLAALNEGELSGVLALNIGTGPIRKDPPPAIATLHQRESQQGLELSTTEFVRPDVPVPGPSVLLGPSRPSSDRTPATTLQDLPKPPMTTVTGFPPPPIPVPPGLSPPSIPAPPGSTPGTSTLLGIATAKPPPIPGLRSLAPPLPPTKPLRMTEAAPGAAPVPTLSRPLGPGIPPLPKPLDLPRADGPLGARPGADRLRPSTDQPTMPGGDRAGTDHSMPPAIDHPERSLNPTAHGGPRPSTESAELSFERPEPSHPEISLEHPEISLEHPHSDDEPELEVTHDPPSSRREPTANPAPLFDPLPDLSQPRPASPSSIDIVRDRGDANEGARLPASAEEAAWGRPRTDPPAQPSVVRLGRERINDEHVDRPEDPPREFQPPPNAMSMPYPQATPDMMPNRGRDSASSRSLAEPPVRPQKSHSRLPLIIGAAVGAIGLAVGGWFVYGMITDDDSGGAVATTPTDGSAVATAGDGGSSTGSGPSIAATTDASPPVDAAPKQLGDLAIVSTPPGARVFINGSDTGQTPLKLPGTPDRHTIALLLAGHELYIAQVDGNGTFSIPLKEVTPSGGPAGIKVIQCKHKDRHYVFVDGKPTGQTCPTERIETSLGPHVVEVYDLITEIRKKWEINITDTRLSYRVRIDN